MGDTDEILDVCFGEGLFNTPLRCSKRTAVKEIPTQSPFKYTNTLLLIYKSQKLNKEGLAVLPCCPTNIIKTRDPSVKEEDILYLIFAVESGGSKGTSAFMRTWLHLFVCMHRKFFNMLAAKYFDIRKLDGRDTGQEKRRCASAPWTLFTDRATHLGSS